MTVAVRSSKRLPIATLGLAGVVIGGLPPSGAGADEAAPDRIAQCRFIVQTAGPIESHQATSWFHYGETPAGCSGLGEVSLAGELEGDEKVLNAVLERAQTPACPEGTEGRGRRGGVEDVDVNSAGTITRREYVVSLSQRCLSSQ